MRPLKVVLDPSKGLRLSTRRRKPAPATGSEPLDTTLMSAPATGSEASFPASGDQKPPLILFYSTMRKAPFVHLTEEEEAEVERSFNSNRRDDLVFHEDSNIKITGEILQSLRPGADLNGEVVNLYLVLLKERENRGPQKFLKCHFFDTYFYNKIFVPIHKVTHWCLAVINKKEEKFQYLDSVGGMDNQVLEVLARYFKDEVEDKSGEDINVSSWEQEVVEDRPVQTNEFDCGMFMIKYADFYSRGLGLDFNQGHMSYFRQRTAKEILRLRAY